jgi:hypothetical protein
MLKNQRKYAIEHAGEKLEEGVPTLCVFSFLSRANVVLASAASTPKELFRLHQLV